MMKNNVITNEPIANYTPDVLGNAFETKKSSRYSYVCQGIKRLDFEHLKRMRSHSKNRVNNVLRRILGNGKRLYLQRHPKVAKYGFVPEIKEKLNLALLRRN